MIPQTLQIGTVRALVAIVVVSFSSMALLWAMMLCSVVGTGALSYRFRVHDGSFGFVKVYRVSSKAVSACLCLVIGRLV